MGYIIPTGRKARELNNNIRMDINRTHEMLCQMIGEHNPVKVQRILRAALTLLTQAANASWELEQLHALNAQRGSYKGEEE